MHVRTVGTSRPIRDVDSKQVNNIIYWPRAAFVQTRVLLKSLCDVSWSILSHFSTFFCFFSFLSTVASERGFWRGVTVHAVASILQTKSLCSLLPLFVSCFYSLVWAPGESLMCARNSLLYLLNATDPELLNALLARAGDRGAPPASRHMRTEAPEG